jgi:hypothetical protein
VQPQSVAVGRRAATRLGHVGRVVGARWGRGGRPGGAAGARAKHLVGQARPAAGADPTRAARELVFPLSRAPTAPSHACSRGERAAIGHGVVVRGRGRVPAAAMGAARPVKLNPREQRGGPAGGGADAAAQRRRAARRRRRRPAARLARPERRQPGRLAALHLPAAPVPGARAARRGSFHAARARRVGGGGGGAGAGRRRRRGRGRRCALPARRGSRALPWGGRAPKYARCRPAEWRPARPCVRPAQAASWRASGRCCPAPAARALHPPAAPPLRWRCSACSASGAAAAAAASAAPTAVSWGWPALASGPGPARRRRLSRRGAPAQAPTSRAKPGRRCSSSPVP